MAVTIYDVAKEAGVSIGTVSKALNDSYTIPDQTKEMIREIADRLGYRPNARAKNFARQATGTVLFITDFYQNIAFENPHMFEIISGITTYLDDKDYALTLKPLSKQAAPMYIRDIIQQRSADAKRKFVIFKKVRPDADDILTPQERLENIAKEERKDILQKIALSYTWSLLQLLQFTGSGFVNRIFSNGLLMISAIWFALALCATVRGVHYLIWKKKWTKMVDNGEEIYFGLKKNIFSFTNGWYSWLSTGILLVFLASLALSQQYLTLVFAVIFSAPIVVMGYLIARFRPDAGTNQIIQIVVSMALVIIVLIFSVVIIFTDDTTTEDEQAIPLYYEDIGGEAGEIIKAEVDQSSSIFGSGMRCWIEYEDEYVYYYVYTSDHAWIIDTIWEDRVVQKYNQTGEDVSDLWGAVAAIRNSIGGYLVKYPDAVLILDFAEDTVLSQSDAEIIRAALLEGR